jgi:hypothetical protein
MICAGSPGPGSRTIPSHPLDAHGDAHAAFSPKLRSLIFDLSQLVQSVEVRVVILVD